MNLSKAIMEMFSMSEQVWKDVEHWQTAIQNGVVAMRQIKNLNLKLFETEDLLNNAVSRRELKITEKRINNLYLRLQRPLATMNQTLAKLTQIRDNTARMLSRLTLWMDDDIVAQHRISLNLPSSKLLAVLQFLSRRYDVEWEVKETVVNALENITSTYEMELLMTGWGSCCHAGGQEFTKMLHEYYEIIGRPIRKAF
ncbi:uncharacterized protein LOC108114217 [Drosophila eugracilis]|uniref:uncharacterized protein LOC108114217 n=1 Tax=Drosophila eugracilis TaxID=29029 RepID=UPI0007E83EBE|nr:uncharacterized protein LOC108114217 [Drosophila eugracilis]